MELLDVWLTALRQWITFLLGFEIFSGVSFGYLLIGVVALVIVVRYTYGSFM